MFKDFPIHSFTIITDERPLTLFPNRLFSTS